MATYVEYRNQIEELQRKAAVARKEELGSAIRDIKKKIIEFSLTAADLGLAPAAAPKRAPTTAAKPALSKSGPGRKKRRATAGVKVSPKYRGPAGELWSGRGRRPVWVAAALASGQTLEGLLIKQPDE